MDLHIHDPSLPRIWDPDKKDDFIYLQKERCRLYSSGVRINDDGRESHPDGTTKSPPEEGCWIRYYDTEEDVPYTPLEKALGAGAFGKVDVVKATERLTIPDMEHRICARKEFLHKSMSESPEKSVAQQNMEKEINIYNQLDKEQPTKHRVKIIDAYTIGMERFFLIMHPVAEGRTLQDKLRDFAFDRATRSAGEVESLYRALGCLTVAIAQLHDKGFRHRDLHPGNVLLHKGEILVCDFGASLHTQYDQRSTTSTDFPPKMERYAAPEVISSLGERNKTADVFSLGAILFEIMSAIHHHERLAKSIRDGGFRYEARLDEVVSDCNPPRASSGVLWYIGQMLERDQQRRLPPKLVAAQFYLLSVNMVEPLMCADCQDWVTGSGEPQRLSRELQEKRDRYRKQGELQKRREGRQDLTELAIKRTRSF